MEGTYLLITWCPVFHRRGWFKGRRIRGQGVSDIAWFKPDGSNMSEEDWGQWFAKWLASRLIAAWLVTRIEPSRSKAMLAGASSGIALPEGPEMRRVSTP